MKKISIGALIGMGIGVVISWIIRFFTRSNIFGDRLLGFLSTGDILLIAGLLLGGTVAYYRTKK